MADKELIAWLYKLYNTLIKEEGHYAKAVTTGLAIDRLEELVVTKEALTKERNEAWKRAAHAEKMWGKAEVKLTELLATTGEQLAAARKDAEEAEAYAGELEAKLATAVDALRAFNSFDDLPTEVKRPDIFEINVRLPILRALAELTGGKDE